MELLQVCAYCERDAIEVVAQANNSVTIEDALQFVRVGNSRVLLCPDDRAARVPLTDAETWEMINAPVDLPAGITALQHNCPMLAYDGFPAEEATFMVHLVADDDQPGYLVGNCRECGMAVRSPIVPTSDAPKEEENHD